MLRRRLQYSALAFSQKDQHLKNNASVVLLLGWRGRRLLFTGDAEWNGKGIRKGCQNKCWDVMLEIDQQNGSYLSEPLDFVKVGHHGSINGTPFVDKKQGVRQPQPILDAFLPEEGEAQVVVSTRSGKHGEEREVPYPNLMEELGWRAGNAKRYRYDLDHPNMLQPQRTDLERQQADQRKPFVDVMLGPASDWAPA